ncbi:MAG: PAS domain S-box protein [Chloroflexota bacterium]|nr:PAS domain S-box protein [Chloroflexota bacterium]
MLKPPRPPDEAKRLQALHELGILDTPPEERFDRITRLAKRLLDVPIALVSLVDSDRQWFKSRVGLSAPETPRDVSFCGHAILGDDALVITDALRDPRFADNPLVVGEPRVRFYAGQPLKGPGGHKMGTMCIIDHRPRRMRGADLQTLNDLAALAEHELNAVGLAEALAQKNASESRLRAVMESTLDGLITIDGKGVIKSFNAAAERIFGYQRSEVLDKNVDMLMPDPPRSRHKSFIRNYLSTGLAKVIGAGTEVTGLRKDGSTFPMELDVSEVQSGDERLFIGIARDITERKQAEVALRESEERFRDLFESANDLIQSVAPDGRILYVNRAWRESLGYTTEEVAHGLSMFAVVHPEHLERCREILQCVTGGEMRTNVETTLVSKDGRSIDVEGSVNCKMLHGRPVYTRGFFRNVTERKRAQEALHRSEEMYRSLVESVGGTVIRLNRGGQRSYVSETTAEQMGRKTEELLAGRFGDAMKPKERQKALALLEETFRTGKPMRGLVTQQVWRGKRRYISANWMPIRDATGNVVEVQATSFDITEQVEAEKALRRLSRQNEKLARSLEAELARAAQVQRALLPEGIPVLQGFDLAALCLPSHQVGGDFYDWEVWGPSADVRGAGVLAFTVADVMGKGMPAALLMATVRAVLRAVSRLQSPAAAMTILSRTLATDLQRSDGYVTLFHARLDPVTHRLTYVDAGHGLTFVRRADGRVEKLLPRYMPLGVQSDPYGEGTITLNKGDVFMAWSDGLANKKSGLPLDAAELAHWLTPDLPALTMVERLVKATDPAWPPQDDLTVVVLRCTGE